MQSFSKYFKPLYAVILADIIGFLLLFFYKQPYDIAAVYTGLVLITLICLTYAFVLKMKMGDGYLFLVVSMLASIGMIILYRLDRYLALKQIVWFSGGIGLFIMCYFAFDRLDIWDRLIHFYWGGSLALFLVTLAFGKNIKGANNWIIIGPFSFQPSELIKVLYVLFLASYLAKPERLDIKGIKIKGLEIKLKGRQDKLMDKGIRPRDMEINIGNRLVFQFASYCYVGFFVLQREFGTALLVFSVFFLFLFLTGSRPLTMLANAGAAVAGGILGYIFLYHIRVRVDVWLNPWKDISNKGYQITQSLFAIGSGGFFGTGLGLGRPDFIPEVQSDFIFAAICEEMGVFGGIAVILLYFIFIYRGFKIALMARQPFHKTVALGITLVFALQTFIILGGVIKLIPMTGITLPFVSYGGSSLVTGFISLGVLQAISAKY